MAYHCSKPSGRDGADLEQRRRLERFLRVVGNVFQVVGPARIVREDFALGRHQPLEFLDAELADQKLQARGVAILLFAEPGEDAGNGLAIGRISSSGTNSS